MKQKGYMKLDLGCFFMAAIIIGIVVGIAIWELLKWIWPFVKAWLHAITD